MTTGGYCQRGPPGGHLHYHRSAVSTMPATTAAVTILTIPIFSPALQCGIGHHGAVVVTHTRSYLSRGADSCVISELDGNRIHGVVKVSVPESPHISISPALHAVGIEDHASVIPRGKNRRG